LRGSPNIVEMYEVIVESKKMHVVM